MTRFSENFNQTHYLRLQSWTKLVETRVISASISQFPCMETPTILQKGFSSPLPSFNVLRGGFKGGLRGPQLPLLSGNFFSFENNVSQMVLRALLLKTYFRQLLMITPVISATVERKYFSITCSIWNPAIC